MNFWNFRRCVLVALVCATSWVGSLSVAVAQEITSHQAAHDAPGVPASVTSRRGVVAADNAQASEVGAAILAAGGNAADAGAAALLADGVLNPFASGLGGGGFCLYRAQPTGAVHVLDFRERAPKKARADMFLVDGAPSQELQLRGGLAVGVPGEPAGLWVLQRRFGTLDWAAVVQPAVDLAHGYQAGALLEKRLSGRAEEDLKKHPKLAALFEVDGRWARAGERLARPALARTLELYRDEGPIVFYHGEVGESIIRAVNGAGGIFAAEDLATYGVEHRDPITGTYRGYEIFSMPPPSSGGAVLVETLNILEQFDLGKNGLDARAVHLIAEALKHSFADRARWMGDADFVDVPLERFTAKDYAKRLARKVKLDGVLPLADYGSASERAPAAPPDDSGTAHLSVIDEQGNMLACTSSINTIFGSMVYDEQTGVLLNNQMADFSAQPGTANNYGLVGSAQNAVAPLKRPLSSMSPTLVLKGGAPFMATGGSGGPTIITGTLLSLINVVDFGMTPVEAIAQGRIHTQWQPDMLFLEPGVPGEEALRAWGHVLNVRPAFNSVQIVVQMPDGTRVGVSDPRKLGAPAAQPQPGVE